MFDFFKREKWTLVKTFKIDRPTPTGNYVYHIHCYETDKGNRKVEYVLNGEPYDIKKPNIWLPTTDFYQMQLLRWLNGRRDPEIPTYEQLGEEDTANFLKGKVN